MGTGIWDKYVFYSDYSPRMEGSELYYGGNEPKTTLVLYPYADGSRRMTYRDRRYILNGFAYPAEFYSPDYSKQTPSEETKDCCIQTSSACCVFRSNGGRSRMHMLRLPATELWQRLRQ